MKRCKERNLGDKRMKKIKEDIKNSKFVCSKCLRSSSKSKNLCRPEPLD